MRKSIIALIVMSLFSIAGCLGTSGTTGKRTLRKVYIQPETPEGRKCASDCKQIHLQQQQLITQTYAAARQEAYNSCFGYSPGSVRQTCLRNLDTGNIDKCVRDMDMLKADREYERCFQSCGGKTTYK